tara:strand:- start:154 stop:708 length:555 start_codon:yes stop_codon:yes gene_type:complete
MEDFFILFERPPTHLNRTRVMVFFLDALRINERAPPHRITVGRVFVHLHGKAKDSSFRAAISDYANRLNSDGVQIIEHRNQTDPGEYLDNIIKKAGKDTVILLQENGENLDSIGYSKKMKEWRISNNSVHLVVGPPGGFGIYGGDLQSLSLGRITLPHELAAVVLLEQLYRSCTIIKGLPYHRA